MSELRRHIETGNSLESLKSEIKNALSKGTISRDTYESVIASIDRCEKKENERALSTIDPNLLPFSQNALAKYLEDQPF